MITIQWTDISPMGTKRSCLGAVAMEGLIYCCGGYDGQSCLSTVERCCWGYYYLLTITMPMCRYDYYNVQV